MAQAQHELTRSAGGVKNGAGSTMSGNLNNVDDAFSLTADCRMLVQIRDTLYEGSWEDFERDLRARAAGRPHVFETIPETPGFEATIAHHLDLIEKMRAWETQHQRILTAADE